MPGSPSVSAFFLNNKFRFLQSSVLPDFSMVQQTVYVATYISVGCCDTSVVRTFGRKSPELINRRRIWPSAQNLADVMVQQSITATASDGWLCSESLSIATGIVPLDSLPRGE